MRAAVIIYQITSVKRLFCAKGSDDSARTVRPYRWGGLRGRKKSPNELKISGFLNKMVNCCFHSPSVSLGHHLWWQRNLNAQGHFSGRLQIPVTDVSWWYSALYWASHKETLSSRQTLASLDNLNSKAKLGPSVLLCLFINQTPLNPVSKLCA